MDADARPASTLVSAWPLFALRIRSERLVLRLPTDEEIDGPPTVRSTAKIRPCTDVAGRPLLRVIMLVLLLVIRPARAAGVRSLAVRLRELDEAYRAGLMSDDERARQRARILDDA